MGANSIFKNAFTQLTFNYDYVPKKLRVEI